MVAVSEEQLSEKQQQQKEAISMQISYSCYSEEITR